MLCAVLALALAQDIVFEGPRGTSRQELQAAADIVAKRCVSFGIQGVGGIALTENQNSVAVANGRIAIRREGGFTDDERRAVLRLASVSAKRQELRLAYTMTEAEQAAFAEGIKKKAGLKIPKDADYLPSIDATLENNAADQFVFLRREVLHAGLLFTKTHHEPETLRLGFEITSGAGRPFVKEGELVLKGVYLVVDGVALTPPGVIDYAPSEIVDENGKPTLRGAKKTIFYPGDMAKELYTCIRHPLPFKLVPTK